jgi:hypothetical protein
MIARRAGLLAGLVTLAAAGWYVFVYLARWEWNRALMAGLLFVAAEIGLLGLLLFDRLARLERRVEQRLERSSGVSRPDRSYDTAPEALEPTAGPDGAGTGRDDPAPVGPDPRILGRVRAAAPPPRQPFAWLDPTDRMSVFVPVLLGAGVLLSGAAWLVERVARLTGGAALERRLAARLDVLALPPGGLRGGAGAGEPPDPFSPAA